MACASTDYPQIVVILMTMLDKIVVSPPVATVTSIKVVAWVTAMVGYEILCWTTLELSVVFILTKKWMWLRVRGYCICKKRYNQVVMVLVVAAGSQCERARNTIAQNLILIVKLDMCTIMRHMARNKCWQLFIGRLNGSVMQSVEKLVSSYPY